MDDLIDILESFNRKERFFLISHALNGRQENPAFTLSDDFRRELGNKVGVCIPEKDVFVAMDYHLNWVHASLVLAHCTDEQGRKDLLGNGGIVNSQQGVDLLVAFKDTGNRYHLIFVEAKGYNTDGSSDGLSSFDNKRERDQLKSKARQLETILKPDGTPYPEVESYFCLMTRKKPNDPPMPWDKWLKLSLPRERLIVKYDASAVKSGEDWKGLRQGRQIVPPKGKA